MKLYNYFLFLFQFIRLQRRVDEMDKSNSLVRNLDLQNMVNPTTLHDRLRTEKEDYDNKRETLELVLLSKI